MPKTRIDVGQQALRRIGVCGIGETASAEDQAQAVISMDGALAELQGQHGITVTWDANTVPDALFMAFSDLVAAELASVYSIGGPNRAGAIGRIRAGLLPDDRTDPRDTNSDGVISTAEAASGLRAKYY